MNFRRQTTVFGRMPRCIGTSWNLFGQSAALLGRSNLMIIARFAGYHLKDDKDHRAHNSHIVLDFNGDIADIYRKAHLFVIDIPGKLTLDETTFCIPGTRIQPPVPTPVGKIGLMCVSRISCYEKQHLTVNFPH